MPLLRHVQRHTIAATASVLLLTAGFYMPVRQGLLENIASSDAPLRSTFILAFALTFILFVPMGAVADWLVTRRRMNPILPPVILAIWFTAFWLCVDTVRQALRASSILPYSVLGLIVGLAFCGYWIPLLFVRRRFSV